jgi:malate dehydrogenase (oxaloacetate-decarboxylating)
MSDFNQESLELHRKNRGKIELCSKVALENREDLSRAYTPGIAAISQAVAADESLMYELTPKGNMVAVVSDGSAVLGLGNIGPNGAYPVMEGKCLLFKKFGGVDAFPIVLKTQNVDEIVALVENISPGFGGINLEDIAAPRCFEIEEKLKARLDIPVFHDDQHGTAIVVLAGLINAIKVVGKSKDLKIILNGAGAAGIAISRLLLADGFRNLILVDTSGAIYEGRSENMNPAKIEMAHETNPNKEKGLLADVIRGADVFIGISKAGALTKEMVSTMNKDAIVFAMANPTPEIMPDEAKAAGAAIIATGRSDFPNQLNNVLVFPGIFRGALDARVKQFTREMFIKAAHALAALVENPSAEKIIASPFEGEVAKAIAQAVK